ncbi:MAG TPA: WG repeat-containing protein [Pyrinomonadaceae bacterium]|nr:WG repeat-containing protein [Pyrinomonadaceae bacterium]
MPDFVPQFLQQIIFKSIAKVPAERYANAAEVREDLMRCQTLLSSENIRIHQTSANNIQVHKTDEPLTNQSSNSLSVATQTIGNLNFINTQDSPIAKPNYKAAQNSPTRRVGLSTQKRKSHKFTYLTAACILLLSIFVTGFYFISKRSPIPFRQGDKFGFATWEKELVIGAKYDRAFQFSNGRAVVALGKNIEGKFAGKYGFIDKEGREIIPLIYDFADNFSGDLAKIGKFDAVSNKMIYGFINLKGEEIISATYEDALSFSNNLAVVKSQGKWGAIDEKGNLIIKFKYDWMDDFSDDLAAVKFGDKYSFINKSGVEILPFDYDWAGKFSNGNAPVKKNGKAFFVDQKGNQSIPFKYENADSFSEGLALVKQNGKAGFIEKQGVEAVAFQYDNDNAKFSEGLAAVKQSGKVGFVNYLGKVIIPFKYVEAQPIQNNLSLVKNTDGKEFYIGFDGTEFYQP